MSIEITADLLDGIKAQARAATPGRWFHSEHGACCAVETEEGAQIAVLPFEEEDCAVTGDEVANAAHIAGLDPQTVLALVARLERAEGIRPEFPPRPPHGEGTPRYGIRWNGPEEPLAVPMDDGYWTPWHLANARAQQLQAALNRYGSHSQNCRRGAADNPCGLCAALAAGQPVPSDLEAK